MPISFRRERCVYTRLSRRIRIRFAVLAALLIPLATGVYASGTWSADSPFPVGLGETSVAALNGIEYVAGGSTDTAASNALYAFDPSTHTWTTRAPYPGPARDHMGLVAANGFLYLAGGFVTI